MSRTPVEAADLQFIEPPAASRLPRLAFSEASLSAVKWLALLLMIVDHTNKYLFDGSVHVMFVLGRISMPLFAFVLGYNLARPGVLARGGYRRVALRLAVFGTLATVPFVAINKLPLGWPLNMMFTLLVAVVAIWLLDRGRMTSTIAACVIVAWGGAVGEYWWPAIGLCVCVWAYQRNPSRSLVAGFVVCLLLLWFVNGNFWALLVIPVLAALQRWWSFPLPRAQWAFYAFYPLHLGVFWLCMR